MASFNGSHLTALISSIGSRMGPPMTRICQNCTILIRPSTEYNIDPRKPWTETWCPVSSNTSRLAAARACSPGLSLPFGSTQDLSLRNRTTAMRGLAPFSKTIPPAARIAGGSFASGRRFMALPSIVSAAHAGPAFALFAAGVVHVNDLLAQSLMHRDVVEVTESVLQLLQSGHETVPSPHSLLARKRAGKEFRSVPKFLGLNAHLMSTLRVGLLELCTRFQNLLPASPQLVGGGTDNRLLSQ